MIHYIKEQGTSIRETAAIFNLSTPSLLSSWKRTFDIEGEDALKPKKKGPPSMKKRKKENLVEGSKEALQAEIDDLRMENDYLKKLNALVQSKEKSQSKTK